MQMKRLDVATMRRPPTAAEPRYRRMKRKTILPHGVDPLGVQVEAEGAYRVDELRPVELHGVPVADRVAAAQGQRVVQGPQRDRLVLGGVQMPSTVVVSGT